MEKVIDHYICFPTSYHGRYIFFEKVDKKRMLHARYGGFITRVIDSGKKQMEWNDITIQFNEEVNCKIYVCISDCYDELLQISKLSKSKQMQYIKQNANIVSNYNHTLLYDDHTMGQYLICMIEIFAKRDQSIMIEEIHFTYPKTTFVECLPTIYHNQLFLQKFLAIYQSLYLDIEKENNNFIQQLDIATCDDMMVFLFANWLAIDSKGCKVEDVRRYIARYDELYALKGTKAYYELLVEIYCGKRGYVIDYENEQYIYANNQIAKNIYSLDSQSFIILISNSEHVDKRYVENMILKEVPITMMCQIVWLDEESCMDQFCYLGYNSYITDIKIDDFTGCSYFDEARMV